MSRQMPALAACLALAAPLALPAPPAAAQYRDPASCAGMQESLARLQAEARDAAENGGEDYEASYYRSRIETLRMTMRLSFCPDHAPEPPPSRWPGRGSDGPLDSADCQQMQSSLARLEAEAHDAERNGEGDVSGIYHARIEQLRAVMRMQSCQERSRGWGGEGGGWGDRHPGSRRQEPSWRGERPHDGRDGWGDQSGSHDHQHDHQHGQGGQGSGPDGWNN